jgi:hypothetical protein
MFYGGTETQIRGLLVLTFLQQICWSLARYIQVKKILFAGNLERGLNAAGKLKQYRR